MRSSQANLGLRLLHTLYEQRDQLGFVLLDREGLSRLEAALPSHEKRQTPYIPPRIWVYQVNRLRTFLDDFHAHRQGIEDCFRFCLEAYAHNAGSLAAACQTGPGQSRLPFVTKATCSGRHTGAVFHGKFSKTAQRFGIEALLQRWVLPLRAASNRSVRDIRLSSFGTYFSMVGYVGLAYILNFSMMRIEEAWSLRADCLEVERDERFGPIHLLHGPTTKTVKDGDARWVTSPTVRIAVEAMACVSRLRMIAGEAATDVPTTLDHVRNPYLVVRTYEPWNRTHARGNPMKIRPASFAYSHVIKAWPNLFDKNELRITEEDLRLARLVTPTIDAKTFSVGNVWPFAWHQLRRTGAVNMQSSGLVSDASVQYQLKHATRAMALYYGQGYSRIRLDESARDEYIRTMYEVLGKQIARLFSDRFVSPHGAERKSEILKLVDPSDSRRLNTAARQGKVSWRETLLGGCTKIGPCEYGGVDNIARCAGGDGRAPCLDALFDREKAPAIQQLKRIIASRLVEAPENSPYRESLQSQQLAAENALNVVLE
jgi:integrase